MLAFFSRGQIMKKDKPVKTIEEVLVKLSLAIKELEEALTRRTLSGENRVFSAIHAEIVLETLMRVSKFILKEKEETEKKEKEAKEKGWQSIILHIFPENIAKAIYDGQVLQIVVFSILFGIALTMVPVSYTHLTLPTNREV